MEKLNCQNASPLLGIGCLNTCSHRHSCVVNRQSLLIYDINLKGQVDVMPEDTGFKLRHFFVWHSGKATVLTYEPDSHVNGRFEESH